MNLWKKGLALCLSAALILSLTACGKQAETPAPPVEEDVTVRIGALKGPTAMGLVNLEESEAGAERYDLHIAASADELTPALIKGELDVACLPANLASVLYNKTEGQIVTIGINTLGVLYIVENGNAVQSIKDLRGTTIAASGKGSTPEYALQYLLKQNGLDPDTDVIIDWKSEHSECVAALASGAATIALLPQPFVTVAQGKIENLRVALDLTKEWDALENGSALLTGVVVARKDFVETHPAAVETLLQDYAASVDWVNANTADAAVKIGEMGIVDAAVAEKALPACNIVCITGSEMKEKLSGYLEVLYDAAAESVGGKLPGDDFYYGA
ncbi:ABC transporter substrate-binding protein [Oscillibacter sp.]|uniref:ABC transporter substrate-binding protein n=1 Tax=Oscillibacter sp. TaxID=1945593 RepID=UPI0026349612|nr:ABC transporter substrate-binding protein [Oscillibacter sp.]MDD3347005.1 ABC transporter substrate-binding protein [Oscillibacter sp.]